MAIRSMWSTLYGNTADAQYMLKWLRDNYAEPVALETVFQDSGLEELHGNYTTATLPALGGLPAFTVAANLASLLVAARGHGPTFAIQPDGQRVVQLATALKYFALSPEDHLVADEYDDLYEAADGAEALRAKLD